MAGTILLVLAFVLTLLAGVGIPPAPGAPRAWHLGWLGVASAILAEILGATHLLGR
jgi:hypothetical protein